MAAPEMACLASFCRWLAAEIDRSEGGMLTMPRALGNVERTLMSLFASAVGGSLPEPGSAAGLSAAALRRIDAWMDAHHAEGIGVEDMARFAGVSVRSLQAAFRRTYGITPSAALLACRLRHARARLSRPLPNTSVTQVALDCGFFHLGRFARQYRQMFGESPSATLRRAT
jgi:transcriptional regulator GlxA family with amidase domain